MHSRVFHFLVSTVLEDVLERLMSKRAILSFTRFVVYAFERVAVPDVVEKLSSNIPLAAI